MNELPQKYNPAEVEDKWYAYWLENKLFESHPDAREAYTVVIPPPNGTHAQQYNSGYPCASCPYAG